VFEKRKAAGGAAGFRERVQRYLVEGRVSVAVVDRDFVSAVYVGDDAVCNLGHEQGRGWWCSCDRQDDCPHLVALQLVTKRAVDLVTDTQPQQPLAWEEAAPAETDTPPAGDKPRQAPTLPPETPPAWDPPWIRMAGTEPKPLETATYEVAPRRRIWPWLLAVLLLTIATVAALAIALRGFGNTAPTVTPASVSSRPPTAPTSPSTSVQPAALARFPEGAFGNGLTLAVTELPPMDASCLTNSIDGDPAYQSDCRSWPSDLYWFYVVLRNRSEKTIDVRLAKFRVLDREGRNHAPLDVTERAGDPQHFVPAAATLGPHDSLAGWLSVQAGANFVPSRIQYPDGQGLLAVEFVGTHEVTPRG
jgi:hypothetical protein